MANKGKFLLALRDGINKLTGKQALIDEYEKITSALTKKSDSMENGAQKKAFVAQIDKLTEHGVSNDGQGGKNYDNFDAYRASKKVLKQKIANGQKLMREYGM